MITFPRWTFLLVVPVMLAAVPVNAGERPASEQTHWAFRTLGRPALPNVRNVEGCRTAIDRFLLAKLEAKGLTFSPAADPVTLMRRAYLDLAGLPPTPEEVDAFLAARARSGGDVDAFEQLVDRLLAAPQFGERWGRHWLDVAGYADTVGFDTDANNLILSEGKWRYRDYVVAAFNRDKPYDRFVTEQLAGDELLDWRRAPKMTPAMRELLIATGYLRTARDESHEPESNIPLTYFGVLHNTVEIIGNSLLGLTLNCCRCHNHKFDPIPQTDYYQLMALLTPAYNPHKWIPVFPWKAEIKDRGLPDVSPAELAAIDKHNHDVDQKVGTLQEKLAAVRRPYEGRLVDVKLRALPEPIRADTKTALATPAAKRNSVQKYLADKFKSALSVKPEEVAGMLSPADRERVRELDGQVAAANAGRRKYSKIQALYDVGPAPATHLLKRGNHDTPGAEVHPGFITVLCESPGAEVREAGYAGELTTGRRTALAHWLTAPDSRASALMARVMVNRIWQHLFGQGIVPTPENFGLSGEPPTHPELLEWLSREFIAGGWRIKPLIKLMMTSAAYRQSSHLPNLDAPGARLDPANQLLWRMRLRRLESEVIRDSILSVSGQLDRSIGGPPILLHARPDGMVVTQDKDLPSPTAPNRRSIYLLIRRAYNLSLLTTFDMPLVAVNCPSRDASAVPLQSLTMLNDVFVTQQAERFAHRVADLAGTRGDKPIRAAFRIALARMPSAAELAVCSQLLERQAATYRAAKRPSQEAAQRALAHLCHTLLNTSEFLYAE